MLLRGGQLSESSRGQGPGENHWHALVVTLRVIATADIDRQPSEKRENSGFANCVLRGETGSCSLCFMFGASFHVWNEI